MQLPQDLPEITVPTLFVCADHITATFWLLGGHEMEEVDSFALPVERKTDNETSFGNGTTNAGSSPELSDEERLHHFSKLVAQKITELVKTKNIERVLCAWPQDLSALIKGHLPHDVTPHLKKEVIGVFSKEPPLDVLRRCFEI